MDQADQCAYWAALVQVPNVQAPDDDVRLMRDPQLIDQTLRRHVKALRRWDVLFGHLALVSKTIRCWSMAGFASFKHYCVERLGMALRTVEQRIALEERLHELPALRAAMDDGRVSYEKARIIAANAERGRMTLHKRVLERDGYRCQVPGCSRTASHAHHIQLRSQSGKDEMSNLISLCVAHHLRGVHKGRIRVIGKAPDQVVWTVTGALPEIEGRWSESFVAA